MNEQDRSRVLVLGASGRIGTLLRRCWQDGAAHGLAPLWQYRTLPAPPSFDRQGLQIQIENLQAIPAPALDALRGTDALLVLSGVTPGPDRAAHDFDANAEIARAAIRLAASIDVPRVLLCSTAAVYGDAARMPGRLREAGPTVPQGAYGHSKLAMEHAAQALSHQLSGVAVTSLRIANIAGADQLLGPGHRMVTLDAFEDGRTPLRSYLGPRALSRILADLIRTPQDLPDCLNITAPEPVEMAALLRAGGFEVALRDAPAGLLARVDLDSTRLAGIVPLQASDGIASDIVRDWQEITGGDAL